MPTTHPKTTCSPPEPIVTESLSACVQRIMEVYFKAHEGLLPAPGLYERVLREVEKPLFLETLKQVKGNKKKAALVLGMSRNTLRKRLIDLAIDPDFLG